MRAAGPSGVDLAKIPEDELRKRLVSMGHGADAIAAVLEARQERLRMQALRGGSGGTRGSGFESRSSKEAPAPTP